MNRLTIAVLNVEPIAPRRASFRGVIREAIFADADGDGVNDYIERIQGRNPKVAGAVPDSNGLVNLQVFTPLAGGGTP